MTKAELPDLTEPVRLVFASALRSRCGIEWGQVDAVHRITGKQEIMDRDHAIAIEIQGKKIGRRLEG